MRIFLRLHDRSSKARQSKANPTEPNRTAQQQNRAHGMSTRWPRRVHLAPTVVVVVLVVGVLSKFSTFLLLRLPAFLLCSATNTGKGQHERETTTTTTTNTGNWQLRVLMRGEEGAWQGGTYVVCVGLTK